LLEGAVGIHLLEEVGFGFVTAFVGSIPIAGPLAVLVIDRAIIGARRAGFYIALGGGLVEALYALGIALLFPALVARSSTVVLTGRGVGAVLLGIFGILLIVHPGVLRRTDKTRHSANFATGATLAALNPTLIASWTIVVGALYAHEVLGNAVWEPFAFAFGVAAGTIAWFGIVLYFSGWTRRFLAGERRTQVLRGLGAALVAASAYLVVRFVRDWSARS
jgi:threonine/homoserine/homoserine lactone efflux protein